MNIEIAAYLNNPVDRRKDPMYDFSKVPPNLPAPVDDGACDHLVGLALPDVSLVDSGSGKPILMSSLAGVCVLFLYPMTGHPARALPNGWDDIPGARGCTPQACTYRDNANRFSEHSITLYGISTQSPEDQAEAKQRLALPYSLLSDSQFDFATALSLPTFSVDSRVFLKRATLVCRDGIITDCVYPVFPSNSDVELVLSMFA
jgi:peroxiredoxin